MYLQKLKLFKNITKCHYPNIIPCLPTEVDIETELSENSLFESNIHRKGVGEK
jgi:hypothetical protein